MESLRYLPWLSRSGWLVTNSTPFININDYPPVEEILKEIRKIRNHKIVDADEIARIAGSSRSGNMVILELHRIILISRSKALKTPWKSSLQKREMRLPK